MKQYFNRLKYLSRTGLSVTLIMILSVLTILVAPGTSVAASLDGESVSLDDPTISQAGVTYTITLDSQSTTSLGCFTVEFDTNAGGTGGLPTGMSIASADLVDGNTTFVNTPADFDVTVNSNVLEFAFGGGDDTVTGGDDVVIEIDGITNGSIKNTSYFAIVNSFTGTDCSTGPVDTDGIGAFVFTDGVVVSAQVNPTLTFTVDSTTCDLGVLTASTTGSCSHTMTAATNATNGYAISYIPTTTLTSGSDTITAIGGTATTSTQGTEQFGLNLTGPNTVPAVGAAKSGGSGVASTNYGTINSFAFDTAGAQVAEAPGLTDLTTFTVSYIANVSASTEAGNYAMTQTYNIVATY